MFSLQKCDYYVLEMTLKFSTRTLYFLICYFCSVDHLPQPIHHTVLSYYSISEVPFFAQPILRHLSLERLLFRPSIVQNQVYYAILFNSFSSVAFSKMKFRLYYLFYLVPIYFSAASYNFSSISSL